MNCQIGSCPVLLPVDGRTICHFHFRSLAVEQSRMQRCQMCGTHQPVAEFLMARPRKDGSQVRMQTCVSCLGHKTPAERQLEAKRRRGREYMQRVRAA